VKVTNTQTQKYRRQILTVRRLENVDYGNSLQMKYQKFAISTNVSETIYGLHCLIVKAETLHELAGHLYTAR